MAMHDHHLLSRNNAHAVSSCWIVADRVHDVVSDVNNNQGQ